MPAKVARPRPTRVAAATRRQILKAAKRDFAKKGLAGARVDEISERVEISKRRLHIYFGNKEDLFLAVLEDAYANIRDAERKLRLEHLEPAEALTTLVPRQPDQEMLSATVAGGKG